MPNRKRSRPASSFCCKMLRPWAIAKCAGANHSLKVNIWERLTNPTVNSAQHFGSRLVLISGSLASVNGCRSGRIYDRDRSSSKPKFKERAREAQTYPAFQGLLAAGGSTRSPFRPNGALGLKNKGLRDEILDSRTERGWNATVDCRTAGMRRNRAGELGPPNSPAEPRNQNGSTARNRSRWKTGRRAARRGWLGGLGRDWVSVCSRGGRGISQVRSSICSTPTGATSQAHLGG